MTDCDIHDLELRSLLRVAEVAVLIDVFLWCLVWVVNGVKRQVQEEGPAGIVTLDQLDRLAGQQQGRVAGLDHRPSVAVPIQNAASVPPAMQCEGIDFTGIVAIVMVEPALQGQVFLLPLPEVPLADNPGGVADVAQHLGDGALVGQHAKACP